jgi:hypothetical protein
MASATVEIYTYIDAARASDKLTGYVVEALVRSGERAENRWTSAAPRALLPTMPNGQPPWEPLR